MSPRLRVQGEIVSCTGQHANLSETKLCLDRSEKELEQIQCHLVTIVWQYILLGACQVWCPRRKGMARIVECFLVNGSVYKSLSLIFLGPYKPQRFKDLIVYGVVV